MRISQEKLKKLGISIFAFACALFLILPLSGCSGLCFTSYGDAFSSRQNALRSSLSSTATLTPGTLKVGYMEKAGAPQYEDDADGEPSGLDIDVAQAVADELGLKVELIPVTSTTSSSAKSLDMLMGVTPSTANGLTVVSSYMETGVGLFSKDSKDISSVKDLVGKTIGYVKGSVTEGVVTGSNLQMQQTTFTSLDDAFKGLQDGKVDFVAAPAFPGASVAMDYDDIHFVCELSTPTNVGIGVAPSNKELISAVETALKNISENGVLNLIDYRWTGTVLKIGGEGLAGFTTTAKDTDVSGDSASKSVISKSNGPGDGSTAGANALKSL